MNAPQDAWAGPLAKRMIDRYRSQALAYVKVDFEEYDETTGEIVSNEAIYPAAGAVAWSRKSERDGVQQGNELEVWIDHQTVPWPITSSDRLQYLNRKWKIVEIESYGSGDDGSAIGPIYITTLNGKIITTIDGKALVIKKINNPLPGYTMYASKVTARAE